MARREPHAPDLTDAEWRLMNALWAMGPASTRALHAVLHGETGWAYTTIKTLLGRLVAKGVLTAQRENGTDVYTPTLRRERARGTAVRRLLARAFGGGAAELAHFLLGSDLGGERLGARERRDLRKILAEDARKERRP
jgi:BlaI family transcriptional regulator, penicillinase repressor